MIDKGYYEERIDFIVRLPQDELAKNSEKVQEIMNGYLSCGGSSEDFSYRMLKSTLEEIN